MKLSYCIFICVGHGGSHCYLLPMVSSWWYLFRYLSSIVSCNRVCHRFMKKSGFIGAILCSFIVHGAVLEKQLGGFRLPPPSLYSCQSQDHWHPLSLPPPPNSLVNSNMIFHFLLPNRSTPFLHTYKSIVHV